MKTPLFCEVCGQSHEGLPLDMGFLKPGAYFNMPLRVRRRWHITSEACVFDDARFFILGYMMFPIHYSFRYFTWGLWAEVSAYTFERYVALFESDGSLEPVHHGAISVEREARFRGMDNLLTTIRFGDKTHRPVFELKPSNHRLCRDQYNGISMHRLQQILHTVLPDNF